MKKRIKAGTSRAAAVQRRALFVEAYIANGGNATAAAKAAGFSAKTAYSAGGRLLKDVEIASEIEQRRAETLASAQEATGVSVERTLRELGRIVYGDPRRLFDADGRMLPIREWPPEVAAMVASVEVEEIKGIVQTKKVKMWDKNSALEKAMKHLGLFENDNAQARPLVVPDITIVPVRVVKDKEGR